MISKYFSDFDETEEEIKENDDNINYDQIPSLVNSKLLLAKIIQIIFIYFE